MGALADTALAARVPVARPRGPRLPRQLGATSQTPRAVLDAMDDYYAHHRGSVHRGVYPLAAEATELFEGARERIARFVNWGVARDDLHRNVTEALNLVAYAWGDANVGPGDRVVVTEMEHHSNFVPWQQLALRTRRRVSRGRRRRRGPAATSTRSTRCWPAATSRSSPSRTSPTSLGTINPVAEIVRRAHDAGAIVVVDGAQAVPQMPVDLARARRRLLRLDRPQGLRATGVGVLHGRAELLDAMPPFITGGHMIASVSTRGDALGAEPGEVRGRHVEHRRGHRPRAPRSTSCRASAWSTCATHERELVGLRARAPARDRRASRSTARATPAQRGALVSFALDGVHPHDVAEILGRAGRSACAPGTTARSRSCAASASAPRRARPSPCTTPTRTSTRSIAGLGKVQEVFALMDDLYREEILEHYKRPHNWGADGRSRPRVLGQQPAVRRRADGHAARRRRGHRRGRALRRPRLRDQPGRGLDGLRRGQGHEGRRDPASWTARSSSTCSGSTSPRRA